MITFWDDQNIFEVIIKGVPGVKRGCENGMQKVWLLIELPLHGLWIRAVLFFRGRQPDEIILISHTFNTLTG